MGLDFVGLIFVFLFFLAGYIKGLLVSVFSFVAILLGMLCSLRLSQTLATYLVDKDYISPGWALAISYITLFIGVILIVRLLARLLEKAVEGVGVGLLNSLLGAFLYGLLGAIFWSILLRMAVHLHVVSHHTVATSKTYPFFSKVAPWFFKHAGAILPFAKDAFSKLDHFFTTLNARH